MSDTEELEAIITRAINDSVGGLVAADAGRHVIESIRAAGYGFSRRITEAEERENAEMWP